MNLTENNDGPTGEFPSGFIMRFLLMQDYLEILAVDAGDNKYPSLAICFIQWIMLDILLLLAGSIHIMHGSKSFPLAEGQSHAGICRGKTLLMYSPQRSPFLRFQILDSFEEIAEHIGYLHRKVKDIDWDVNE